MTIFGAIILIIIGCFFENCHREDEQTKEANKKKAEEEEYQKLERFAKRLKEAGLK